MSKNILKELKDRILVLDGAMGTIIQEKYRNSIDYNFLNIKDSKFIESIHKSYIDAGADVILTATFGANKFKLKQHNLQNKVREINEKAVENVKKISKNNFICGDIGPLGEYIEPLGSIKFDVAISAYKEQVKYLKSCDLILIETIADIKILKAAIIATKEVCNLPIFTSMTFEGRRTPTGTDIETYVNVAESLGVDIIGVNCSSGPEELLVIGKKLMNLTSLPIALQPNAGIPKLINGKTVFNYNPKKFGFFAKKYAELGINLIGGCCGTTYEHIKEVVKNVKDIKPKKRHIKRLTKFSSRTKTVSYLGKTLIVGERINPTGRKKLKNELKEYKINLALEEAINQVNEGAQILDINVGVLGCDEKKNMENVIKHIQEVVDIPIMIDTSNIEVLESALKLCDGKPIINSVNASEKSLNSILPLVKKYGTAVIGLTLNEESIPDNFERRIELAKIIINKAKSYGIRKEDLIIDPLTLTVATNPENEEIILKAVKEIHSWGYNTVLGISNISHGLPNRAAINKKFFEKAKKNSLTLAIINPLHMKDKSRENKIDLSRKISYNNLDIKDKLYNCVVYGDYTNINRFLEIALKDYNALEINDILIRAMKKVGEYFDKKEYYLPQVIASANTMKIAFKRLKQEIKSANNIGNKKKIIFATVQEDVHDIGKNIVIAVLESHGYKIIDLGKSVSCDMIINTVKKENPSLVALSALMTTTAPYIKEVVEKLKQENLKVAVMAGGAVITEEYANEIHANYAKNAIDAVKKLEEIFSR
jgi:5-methyltetrahydrofolate--homocysteine methyltransferase